MIDWAMGGLFFISFVAGFVLFNAALKLGSTNELPKSNGVWLRPKSYDAVKVDSGQFFDIHNYGFADITPYDLVTLFVLLDGKWVGPSSPDYPFFCLDDQGNEYGVRIIFETNGLHVYTSPLMAPGKKWPSFNTQPDTAIEVLSPVSNVH